MPNQSKLRDFNKMNGVKSLVLDEGEEKQLQHRPGRGRPTSEQSLTHWVRRMLLMPSQIRGVNRLKIVANRIVRCAENGEEWAIRAVWERLDGRVKDEVSMLQMPTINIQTNVQVTGRVPGADPQQISVSQDMTPQPIVDEERDGTEP